MTAAAKLLAEALQLPETEREDLAASLLDSFEPPPGSRSRTRTRSDAGHRPRVMVSVASHGARFSGSS
jgi:hypothetical protein